MDGVNAGPGVVATKEEEQEEERDTAISYSEAKSPACEAMEQHTNGGWLRPGQGELVYPKGALLILSIQRK